MIFRDQVFSFWPFWNNKVSSNREDVEIRIEHVEDQKEKQQGRDQRHQRRGRARR